MPAKKQEKSFFRPLIANAVAQAWHHRELWPIAAVAGLAGIGAGVNDVLTQARLASLIPSGADPKTLLGDVSFLSETLKSIAAQEPQTIALVTLFLCALICIGGGILAWCQHILLRVSHHAILKKEPLSLQELGKDATHPQIFRILTIDLFIKILIINVLILSGRLIAMLHPTTSFFDAFFGIIFSTVTLGIAFLLNILGILALIAIIKEKAPVGKSLEKGWEIIRKNPVACSELALLLFAVTFAISLIAITGLILIGSLSIPFFNLMINEGTLLGMTLVTLGTALVGTTCAVGIAGFSTLITYLSWTAFYESCTSKKTTKISRGKIHIKRTLTHFFS